MNENGRTEWIVYDDLKGYDSDFEAIGADFEVHHSVASGLVGLGRAKLMSQVALVDFASNWIDSNRD